MPLSSIAGAFGCYPAGDANRHRQSLRYSSTDSPAPHNVPGPQPQTPSPSGKRGAWPPNMLTTDILSWKQLSRRKQKPVHLILFITDHCNAKCGHCFYWENLNQGESLNTDHIEKISRAMGELVWLDISGGEPFLRKDIDQICHRFLDYNQAKFINIPTNAIQTDVIGNRSKEFLRTPTHSGLNIALSIDGIGENHDRSPRRSRQLQESPRHHGSSARDSLARQAPVVERGHHRDAQQHRGREAPAPPGRR